MDKDINTTPTDGQLDFPQNFEADKYTIAKLMRLNGKSEEYIKSYTEWLGKRIGDSDNPVFLIETVESEILNGTEEDK